MENATCGGKVSDRDIAFVEGKCLIDLEKLLGYIKLTLSPFNFIDMNWH